MLGIGNELWSRLLPLFGHNQIFVCVDQQIKGTYMEDKIIKVLPVLSAPALVSPLNHSVSKH